MIDGPSRGGPRVRRLPAVAVPAEGESFHSWLVRTGHLLGVAPGVLSGSLGLPLRNDRSQQVRLFGVLVDSESLERIAAATGLQARQIEEMHLSHYDGIAVSLPQLTARTERAARTGTGVWARLWGSRACPQCLEGQNGVWKLRWKLSTSASCVEHGVLLVDRCPACGCWIHTDRHGGPRRMSMRAVLSPTQCGAESSTGTCEYPLHDQPAKPAAPAVLGVQRSLDAALDGEAMLAGSRVHPAEYFQTVRALVALTRFTAPDGATREARHLTELLVERPGPRGGGDLRFYTVPPATSEAMAASLLMASGVLAAGTPEEFDQLLRPLADAVAARRVRLGRDPLRGFPMPDSVRHAMDAAVPRGRVVKAAHPSRPLPLAPGQIPAFLPEPLYELVRPHLAGAGQRGGRQFGAMAVARLAGARSWAECGRWVRMSERDAVQRASRFAQRVVNDGEFWAAVEQVAHLLAREDSNYPARQTAAQDLVEVPVDAVQVLLDGVRGRWTSERGRHGATWIWTEWAGGDIAASPAMLATDWAATAESRREGWREWRRWAPQSLRLGLLSIAPRLVRR